MPSLSTTILWLAIAAATARVAASEQPNVLVKDVAIIGGAASGVYAGVRLRDDYGKSIAIVELQDRLVSKTYNPSGTFYFL